MAEKEDRVSFQKCIYIFQGKSNLQEDQILVSGQVDRLCNQDTDIIGYSVFGGFILLCKEEIMRCFSSA